MIALAIEMGVYDDDKDEENSNNDLEAAAANDLKAAAADQLVVTVAEQEDTAAESEHSSRVHRKYLLYSFLVKFRLFINAHYISFEVASKSYIFYI